MTFRLKLSALFALCGIVFMAYGDDVANQLSSLQDEIVQLQNRVYTTPYSDHSLTNVVTLNPALTDALLNNQNGVGKELFLLKARQSASPQLTLGGEVEGDALYSYSNVQGIFYNPALNDVASISDDQVSRFLLSRARAQAIANVNNWTSAYLQVGDSNVGDTSASGFGVEQAYVLFGNLNQLPVYAFAGKKDIDFGRFDSVNLYSQPLTRTMFMATGDTLGVGYNGHGLNGVLSVMNGGNTDDIIGVSNFVQSANLPSSDFSQANSLSDFALNLNYTINSLFQVGAGYLNGTAFESNGAAEANGAYDINAKFSGYNTDIIAEYVVTQHPIIAGGNNASAWALGADYTLPQLMGMANQLSAEYSVARSYGVVSTAGSYANEIVLGYRLQPLASVWTGIEYAYNRGGVASASSFSDILVSGNPAKNQTVLLDVTAMF